MKLKEGLEQEWNLFKEKNTQDAYSKCAYDASVSVMEALDSGATPEEAKKKMYGHELTGFLAGCVAQTVSYFSPRGEEFRSFWNNQYGISEDKEGVVNPALMTIKSK